MHSESNIPKSICEKIGRNLHQNNAHPIGIIKTLIYSYFDCIAIERCEKIKFEKFESLDPIVTVENNFDSLVIPMDHPARSKSDTYYVDNTRVLRTHTSAHQNDLMKNGMTKFLVTGDVYRKEKMRSMQHIIQCFIKWKVYGLIQWIK